METRLALDVMRKQSSFTSLLPVLFGVVLTIPAWSQNPPRPNTFNLQSAQAGSTTDIDNLRVIDLDTGAVVYTNSFNFASDATNKLNLFYFPQGGRDTTNYVLNGSMTRVVNGKLRLETTGFLANGSGGYESHSDAEFDAALPRNFLIDFDAVRLQWAGHFGFHVFYKAPTDALCSHAPGGSLSTNRFPPLRVDLLRMSASGSWFNPYGITTNSAFLTREGWSVSFPAPGGSLQNQHRLGLSLSNSTVRFYMDGVLLNSADVSNYLADERIALLKAVRPAFQNLRPGFNYQMQITDGRTVWTNFGAPFTATSSNMVYPQYLDVDNWGGAFFRLMRQ